MKNVELKWTAEMIDIFHKLLKTLISNTRTQKLQKSYCNHLDKHTTALARH